MISDDDRLALGTDSQLLLKHTPQCAFLQDIKTLNLRTEANTTNATRSDHPHHHHQPCAKDLCCSLRLLPIGTGNGDGPVAVKDKRPMVEHESGTHSPKSPLQIPLFSWTLQHYCKSCCGSANFDAPTPYFTSAKTYLIISSDQVAENRLGFAASSKSRLDSVGAIVDDHGKVSVRCLAVRFTRRHFGCRLTTCVCY